jgi:hypothetical protein
VASLKRKDPREKPEAENGRGGELLHYGSG